MGWLGFGRSDLVADSAIELIENRFIPMRTPALLRALADECARHGGADDGFDAFAAALRDVIEQEAAAFNRMIVDAYALVDPDCDTIAREPGAAPRAPEAYAKLIARLSYLLDKANFEPLDAVEIDRAIQVANSHGLRVKIDPARVELVAIWVRGRGAITRRRRTWRRPIRGVEYTLPVYRRLAVVARLKGDPNVQIKLFKDIPEEDVEALLPHAEIAMTWLDRMVMVSGGVSKAGSTLARVITGAMLIGQMMSLLALALPIILWRLFSGYRNARLARDSQRTRHLYYQSLANNSAAIHALVSLIEQEEIKEIALVYATCLTAATEIENDHDVQHRIESFLQRRCGATVDFDIRDGLKSMERLELWSDAARYRVLPPSDAAQRLIEHWARRRSERCHERLSG